jgi:hypothetical protein
MSATAASGTAGSATVPDRVLLPQQQRQQQQQGGYGFNPLEPIISGDSCFDDSAYAGRRDQNAAAPAAAAAAAGGSLSSNGRRITAAAAAAAASGIAVLDAAAGKLHHSSSSSMQQVGSVRLRFRVAVEQRVSLQEAELAVQQLEAQTAAAAAAARPAAAAAAAAAGPEDRPRTDQGVCSVARTADGGSSSSMQTAGSSSSCGGDGRCDASGPGLQRSTALNDSAKHAAEAVAMHNHRTSAAAAAAASGTSPLQQMHSNCSSVAATLGTSKLTTSASSSSSNTRPQVPTAVPNNSLRPDTVAALAADAAADAAALDAAGSAEGSLLLLLRWVWRMWRAGLLPDAPQVRFCGCYILVVTCFEMAGM